MFNTTRNEIQAKNNEIIQKKSLKFFICILAKIFHVPSNLFFLIILMFSLIFGERGSSFPIDMYLFF